MVDYLNVSCRAFKIAKYFQIVAVFVMLLAGWFLRGYMHYVHQLLFLTTAHLSTNNWTKWILNNTLQSPWHKHPYIVLNFLILQNIGLDKGDTFTPLYLINLMQFFILHLFLSRLCFSIGNIFSWKFSKFLHKLMLPEKLKFREILSNMRPIVK